MSSLIPLNAWLSVTLDQRCELRFASQTSTDHSDSRTSVATLLNERIASGFCQSDLWLGGRRQDGQTSRIRSGICVNFVQHVLSQAVASRADRPMTVRPR